MRDALCEEISIAHRILPSRLASRDARREGKTSRLASRDALREGKRARIFTAGVMLLTNPLRANDHMAKISHSSA